MTAARIVGVDHFGFTVADIDRSVEYYRLILQKDPIHRGLYSDQFVADELGYPEVELDVAFFELPNPAVLELLEYKKPKGTPNDPETCNPGNVHLCLLVEDLSAEFNRLTQAGVQFRQEVPALIDNGPYTGGKAAYLRDPDGISIQMLELPGEPKFRE